LAFVQFWEFLIWLYVYPAGYDVSLCPKVNTAFTAMVYFHGVIFWPPIVNLFAYRTTSGNKAYFLFPLFYGIIYTLLGFVDFFWSQFHLKYTTCGVDGKTFLKWEVALTHSRILPNGYDWFLFTAFPFLFYKPRPIGWTMMFWLIATFAIPFALVTLGEAASIFCWLGVGFFILYIADPLIVKLVKMRCPGLLTFELPFLSAIEKRMEEATVLPSINSENGENDDDRSDMEMDTKLTQSTVEVINA